jgi:hypothetical protein
VAARWRRTNGENCSIVLFSRYFPIAFLNDDGIAELVEARLSGEVLLKAKSDVEWARSGVGEAVDVSQPEKAVRNEAGHPGGAQLAPIPLRVEDSMISVPHLNVPRGDGWDSDDDLRVGKFALPEFDHGRLCVELQQFRAFWTQFCERARRGQTRPWKNR